MDTNIFLVAIILMVIFQFTRHTSDSIEQFSDNKTAVLNFMADDVLHVYHLKSGETMPKGGRWYGNLRKPPLQNTPTLKFIGSAFCCNRVVKMTAPNFSAGDKIIFYYRNTGGPGYIAGDIYWNGQYYPTNNTDYACSGVFSKHKFNGRNFRAAGKRLGCYRDGSRRRLRKLGGVNMSNEKCRDIAIARGDYYYGMQYGGECWTDKDIFRAKSYGKMPDAYCNMRGKNGSTRWTQRQGGGYMNDLHETRNAPKLRHCGRANKKPIHSDAFKIKTEQGPNCAHSELGWVEITFATEPSNIIDKEYCPDPNYTEFNAAACADSSNRDSCNRTPHKGFTSKQDKCVNILNVSQNNYGNKDFYSIVSSAIGTNAKYANKTLLMEFQKAAFELMEVCCAIKSTDMNVEYLDDEKCMLKVEEMFSKDKNTHFFFGNVNSAAKLCKNPKLGNPQLCQQFHTNVKDIIKYARRINFTTNNKQASCSCPVDLVNGVSIVAKDTALYIAKYDSSSVKPYTVNNLNMTSDSTISVWLKPSEIYSSRKNFYHSGYAGEGSITLERNGSLSYYYGYKGGDNSGYQGFSSRMSIKTGVLTHVALVRDLYNNTLTWFINGKITNKTKAKYRSVGRTGWKPKVGSGYAKPYKGIFHHLRIYRRPLKSDEIIKTFREGVHPKNNRHCGPC